MNIEYFVAFQHSSQDIHLFSLKFGSMDVLFPQTFFGVSCIVRRVKVGCAVQSGCHPTFYTILIFDVHLSLQFCFFGPERSLNLSFIQVVQNRKFKSRHPPWFGETEVNLIEMWENIVKFEPFSQMTQKVCQKSAI